MLRGELSITAAVVVRFIRMRWPDSHSPGEAVSILSICRYMPALQARPVV